MSLCWSLQHRSLELAHVQSESCALHAMLCNWCEGFDNGVNPIVADLQKMVYLLHFQLLLD